MTDEEQAAPNTLDWNTWRTESIEKGEMLKAPTRKGYRHADCSLRAAIQFADDPETQARWDKVVEQVRNNRLASQHAADVASNKGTNTQARDEDEDGSILNEEYNTDDEHTTQQCDLNAKRLRDEYANADRNTPAGLDIRSNTRLCTMHEEFDTVIESHGVTLSDGSKPGSDEHQRDSRQDSGNRQSHCGPSPDDHRETDLGGREDPTVQGKPNLPSAPVMGTAGIATPSAVATTRRGAVEVGSREEEAEALRTLPNL